MIKGIFTTMMGIAITIGIVIILSALNVPISVGDTWWWIIVITSAILCAVIVFSLAIRKK